MQSAIKLPHTPQEIGITAFIVLSCVVVAVRGLTQSEFINESESEPSEMATPMKATFWLRVLVIVFALLIGGGAIWEFFKT
jgi:hypothetical protein